MRHSAALPKAHGACTCKCLQTYGAQPLAHDAAVEGLLPTPFSQQMPPTLRGVTVAVIPESMPAGNACDELARLAALSGRDHLRPCMLARLLAITFVPREASMLAALAS